MLRRPVVSVLPMLAKKSPRAVRRIRTGALAAALASVKLACTRTVPIPMYCTSASLLASATAVERVDEWIQLLYDQAQIAEGSPLEDPAAFNQRITALLKDASERLVAPASDA